MLHPKPMEFTGHAGTSSPWSSQDMLHLKSMEFTRHSGTPVHLIHTGH